MTIIKPNEAFIVLFTIVVVLGGCSDRVRDTCETKPTAPRCDTSTGATTP